MIQWYKYFSDSELAKVTSPPAKPENYYEVQWNQGAAVPSSKEAIDWHSAPGAGPTDYYNSGNDYSMAVNADPANPLSFGKTYCFRVRAANCCGEAKTWSPCLCLPMRNIPDRVPALCVKTTCDKVDWSWDAPTDNGSPITSYQIAIENDANNKVTYSSARCGSDPTKKTCSMPMASLLRWNYGLKVSDYIYVYAKACNREGCSKDWSPKQDYTVARAGCDIARVLKEACKPRQPVATWETHTPGAAGN